MKIKFENDDEVLNLIFDALCNGLSTLYNSGVEINIRNTIYKLHRREGDCIEDVYKRILEKGGSLTFFDIEDPEDAGYDGSFNLAEAKQRLEDITNDSEGLKCIFDMFTETGDGYTASNFLQLCLYKEIIFG